MAAMKASPQPVVFTISAGQDGQVHPLPGTVGGEHAVSASER